MLLCVVASLSHLPACVPASRQEPGEAGREASAGRDTGEEGRWWVKGESRLDADGGYLGKEVWEPLAHCTEQWLSWVSGDLLSHGSLVWLQANHLTFLWFWLLAKNSVCLGRMLLGWEYIGSMCCLDMYLLCWLFICSERERGSRTLWGLFYQFTVLIRLKKKKNKKTPTTTLILSIKYTVEDRVLLAAHESFFSSVHRLEGVQSLQVLRNLIWEQQATALSLLLQIQPPAQKEYCQDRKV